MKTITPTLAVPPGWYGDPNGTGLQRWWTGRDWSSVTRPAVEVAPITIVRQRQPVNHPLHFCLTLLTLGLWLPVWLIVAIAA